MNILIDIEESQTGDQPALNWSPSRQTTLPKSRPTVLVAEDDRPILDLMVESLRDAGYCALPASDGQEALQLLEQNSGLQVDLLLTDMVMPKVGGKELAYRLRLQSPRTAVLYCSGYPKEIAAINKMLPDEIAFLQKPFTRNSLLEKVREVIGQRDSLLDDDDVADLDKGSLS